MTRPTRVQSGNERLTEQGADALGEVNRPLKARLKRNVTNSACEFFRQCAAGKERRDKFGVYP